MTKAHLNAHLGLMGFFIAQSYYLNLLPKVITLTAAHPSQKATSPHLSHFNKTSGLDENAQIKPLSAQIYIFLQLNPPKIIKPLDDTLA